MRVVFLGSPTFAVAALQALCRSKHQVVSVITQPDRPAGRGLKLLAPPVKEFALAQNIPVLQPDSVNSPECLAAIAALDPDILTVVAYGEFLKKPVLAMGKFPPVNVHPSLLPELRGAAPVPWAIVRGYKESGITVQKLALKMDAGDILRQIKAPIGENETSAEVLERFAQLGGDLLVETLDALAANTVTPKAQDEAKMTIAPLLKREDGYIDWSRSAETIHNLVRGLSPWPAASCLAEGQRLKILSTKLASKSLPLAAVAPGVLVESGRQVFVGTGAGFLELLQVQPEGKRSMLPGDFLNGMKSRWQNPSLPRLT